MSLRSKAKIKRILPNHLSERVKVGYSSFCEGTSCHGFAELYQAESKPFTLFWILIVTSSLAITAYQTYQAVQQYMDQPTSTGIGIAEERGILYPPMKLCYSQWFHWVDWPYLAGRYSKELVLVALSYAYKLNSDKFFNTTEVQRDLIEIMKKHNFTTLKDFYKGIARLPKGEFHKPSSTLWPSWSDFDIQISEYDRLSPTIYPNQPDYLFCYITKQSWFLTWTNKAYMFEYSQTEPKTALLTIPHRPYADVKDKVSLNEFNKYAQYWTSTHDQMYKANLTDYVFPILISPNSYDKHMIPITSRTEKVYVSLKASVFARYNKGNYPCRESKPQLGTNLTCKEICYDLLDKELCKCQRLDRAINVNNDRPDTVCKKSIDFPDTASSTVEKLDCGYDSQSLESNSQVRDCASNCVTPCTIWKWDYSTQIFERNGDTRSDGNTRVTIEYPFADHIVVFTETSVQSFQNFVANIGGLLGIWTGASIISFIQLIYLCCCTGTKDSNVVSLIAVKNLKI